MDFNMVDMIIVGLTLFLAIKGLVNGFSKELFNFLALIGGIVVAARTHVMVGEFISKQELIPNLSGLFQNFLGFLLVLLAVWLFVSFISSIVSKLTSERPGFISRVLGYILSLARNIFVFSLIIYGISNADFLKEKLSKHYEKSQLFPKMVTLGEKLLNVEADQTDIQTNTQSDTNQSNHTESNLSIDLNSVTLTEHNTSN